SPGPLAGNTPSATVVAGDAGEVKVPSVDGDALTAQDAANNSRGGGAH
ncbi:hypothetical protein N311_09240, partial [Apaloderma vittatum]